ncbi:MAG: ECF transporter S component, partial [Candidatus Odinarchaeia archaeon]
IKVFTCIQANAFIMVVLMNLTEIYKSRVPNYPNTVQITLIALFAAITAVFTIIIQIPVPATSGYINIGDVGVMLSGLLFGPIIGGLAGGIGSFLADVILGYAFFAPWTLIIKGLEGFLAGLISKRENTYLDFLACFVFAGPWMVLGYFSVESAFFGGVYAALVEVPGNVIQFVVGGGVSIPLSIILRKYVSQIIS